MSRKIRSNKQKRSTVSRRQMLQLLAAFGITGPAALEVLAQSGKKVLPEVLKTANALIDQEFASDRLPIIAAALQRNLDQFQVVRDLEIDDLIEPATIFMARGR